MLKNLDFDYTNPSGGASITMPRTDNGQTLLDWDVTGTSVWSVTTASNGIDHILTSTAAGASGTITFELDADPYTIASVKASAVGAAGPAPVANGPWFSSDALVNVDHAGME